MTGKSGLRRIFVAIDLSGDARSECARHVDEMRRNFPNARIGWERPEKLHITLKFLGRTDERSLAKLSDHLSQMASELSPAALRLNATGIFPNRNRPRIFWIGVDDPLSVAGAAATRIETVTRDLGFEADDRRFTPHITIGRVRDHTTVRDAADSHLNAQIEPVEFKLDALVVYESKLLPTGSVYSVVSRFPSP